MIGRLAAFVRTNFLNRKRMGRLREICPIVIHARDDDTMPFAISLQLRDANKGTNRVLFAEHPSAGHACIIGQVPTIAAPPPGAAQLGDGDRRSWERSGFRDHDFRLPRCRIENFQTWQDLAAFDQPGRRIGAT